MPSCREPISCSKPRGCACARIASNDLEAIAAILGDAETMRYYPKTFTRDGARRWIDQNLARYRDDGYGLWAMELRATGEFAGNCGPVARVVQGVREVEIGWHVARRLWGLGLAPEAAAACRDYGVSDLGIARFISLIRPINTPRDASPKRSAWSSRRRSRGGRTTGHISCTRGRPQRALPRPRYKSHNVSYVYLRPRELSKLFPTDPLNAPDSPMPVPHGRESPSDICAPWDVRPAGRHVSRRAAGFGRSHAPGSNPGSRSLPPPPIAVTIYRMTFELAGPVEFSTGDLVILVVAGALLLFGLPLLAAAVTYIVYRKRARTDPATPSALGRAGIAFVAVFGAQMLMTWILSWFYEM